MSLSYAFYYIKVNLMVPYVITMCINGALRDYNVY